MKKEAVPKYYPQAEERLNVATHALGLVASAVMAVLMVLRGLAMDREAGWISGLVFGVCLMLLYGASTAYHATLEPKRRMKLRVLDHAAIFMLIAGTYTPFCLLVLPVPFSRLIFGILWGTAAVGISLKLFFTGRFSLVSTLLYVAMGWVAIWVVGPLQENMAAEGLNWVWAGGAAYTIGAVLYSIKKMPFHHAIFHVFVLLGSAFHVVAIYGHVLVSSIK